MTRCSWNDTRDIAFIQGRKDNGDFILIGVYEPNKEIAFSLSKKYSFNRDIIYNNLRKMLDKVELKQSWHLVLFMNTCR